MQVGGGLLLVPHSVVPTTRRLLPRLWCVPSEHGAGDDCGRRSFARLIYWEPPAPRGQAPMKALETLFKLQHAADEPQANPKSVLPIDIQMAVLNKDMTVVDAWLDGDGHVDATCDSPDGGIRGMTLLMLASVCGCAPLIERLLEHRALVDVQASDGFSALMCAAARGHSAIVRRLLRAGAQMGLRTAKGMTALQVAKIFGHAACVGAIKEHVKEVAAARSAGTAGAAGAAAAAAAACSSPKLVIGGEIMNAAAKGDAALVVAWLNGGGHIDAAADSLDGSICGITLLTMASCHGRAPLVEVLLERRASLDLQDSVGSSALMCAALNGHIGIVQRLLGAGC